MDELVLTAEGARALADELRQLTEVGRAEIAERLRQAREPAGDLSDNADYLDAKSEQERLERRIALLEQQLRDARVVGPDESAPGQVSLGKQVTLEDLDSGEREQYRLVGSPEANPAEGRLSIESPVGQAIVARRVGETVLVQAPRRQRRLKILTVRSA